MPSIDENLQPLTGNGDFSKRVNNLEWDDKLPQTNTQPHFFNYKKYIRKILYEMNNNDINRSN